MELMEESTTNTGSSHPELLFHDLPHHFWRGLLYRFCLTSSIWSVRICVVGSIDVDQKDDFSDAFGRPAGQWPFSGQRVASVDRSVDP